MEFLRPDSFGTAPSSTSILLDEVMCTGDESVLVDCIHSPVGIHNCAHNEDVNLRCESVLHICTCTCIIIIAHYTCMYMYHYT